MQIPSDPSERNGRTLVVVSVGGRAGGGTSCKADAGIRMVFNFFSNKFDMDLTWI